MAPRKDTHSRKFDELEANVYTCNCTVRRLTYVIGGAEDLAYLRALEHDARDLEVAELDVAVREAAHHHQVLRLQKSQGHHRGRIKV